jgi:hypothetical protein
MKAAIRIFALFVAFAGLVSASFTAPPTHALPLHMSAAAGDPGPGPLTLPVPPCPNGPGTCFAPSPSPSNR